MKTNKKGFWRDSSGVSIVFSIFVIFVTVITFAIINLAISPAVQETVIFTNTYNADNADKYLESVHRNQNDAYRFLDAFPIIMLITLFAWSVVNAIKRGWETSGGE